MRPLRIDELVDYITSNQRGTIDLEVVGTLKDLSRLLEQAECLIKDCQEDENEFESEWDKLAREFITDYNDFKRKQLLGERG